MTMPNLQQPEQPSSDLSPQRYAQIVEKAWQQTQGRAPRARMHDDDGRAAESGRSGGQLQSVPAQRFAHHLLQELERAGCMQVRDALRIARALNDD